MTRDQHRLALTRNFHCVVGDFLPYFNSLFCDSLNLENFTLRLRQTHLRFNLLRDNQSKMIEVYR